MRIEINKRACSGQLEVDRDSTQNDYGREGLSIYFQNGGSLHFEDEADAEIMARKILYRLGIDLTEKGQ